MVEKSTVDKKQPELYPKLKRVDPRILKRCEPDRPPTSRPPTGPGWTRWRSSGRGRQSSASTSTSTPASSPPPRQRQSEAISLLDQAASRVEDVEDEHDRKELRKDVQEGPVWLLEHFRVGRRRSGPCHLRLQQPRSLRDPEAGRARGVARRCRSDALRRAADGR